VDRDQQPQGVARELPDVLGALGDVQKLARYQYDNGLLREAVATAGPIAPGHTRSSPSMNLARCLQVVLNYGQMLVAYGDADRGLAATDEALRLDTKANVRLEKRRFGLPAQTH
jgi:hypothetical protein